MNVNAFCVVIFNSLPQPGLSGTVLGAFQMLTICSKAIWIVGLTALAGFGAAQAQDAGDTPQKIVAPLVAGLQGEAIATIEGDKITVVYNMDAWDTPERMRKGFTMSASEVVPALLQRFPNVQTIVLSGEAKLTGAGGGSKAGLVARAMFTRKKTDSVKWEGFKYSDAVLKAADAYWFHNALGGYRQ